MPPLLPASDLVSHTPRQVHLLLLGLVTAVTLCSGSVPARAQLAPVRADAPKPNVGPPDAANIDGSDPDGSRPKEAKPDEAKHLGLSVGLEAVSAYVFRGLNLFGGGDQGASHGLFAPSLTWSIFDTGLSLSWWSAYQLNGDNRSALVDTGVGSEQDIVLGYTHNLLDDRLTFSASFVAYLYPFASSDELTASPPGAGTACPIYLEPGVGITYNGPIEVGLTVAYFAGVQDALADLRYLYLNPRVGKTFEVAQSVGLSVGLSYGYKQFNDPDKMVDNVHDLRFDLELPIAALNPLTVTPELHLAWTNFRSGDASEGYVVYGGVKIGYDI